MKKKTKQNVEFRYYEIPQNMPVLALLGQEWIRAYGLGIDCLHFHNLIEIGYCLEGTGELVYDGESFPYSKGSISFIPANFPHTTNSTEGTLSSWEYIFVDTEILNKAFGNDPVFIHKITNRINMKAIVMHASDYPAISNIVLGILDEMRYKKELFSESVSSLLVSLFLQIARINNSEAQNMNAYSGLYTSFIASVIDYITANYENELTISDLAETFHMSETHFRRLFEKTMNMKPMEYVNLVRVQAACDYMKKHDSQMSIVAIKNGFQTTSTMNRNFNKFLGITPYQWKSHPENYEGKLLNYKITALKGWL